MKTILQSEASECGLACLAMIGSHFGYSIEMTEIRRKFAVSLKGATLAQLIRHAAVMHFATRPLRLELSELSQLALPCILHWNLNHFVVLKHISKDMHGRVSAVILDPAVGERRVATEEISKSFSGVALEFSPTPAFEKREQTRKVSIRDLTGKIFGLKSAVVKLVVVAFALEILALGGPLLNQYVIDEVIVSGDHELLKVLCIGFFLLMVVQTSLSLARSWFLMRWSMEVSLQWTSRVLSHLFRLPISYFEKRHVGDVMSRIGSLGSIQGTLTSVFVESLLDGVMTIIALVVMLLYSPKLTFVVIVAVSLYAILRWAFYRSFREASQERLILSAKEGSHFLESLRAMTPLKLFGRENTRLSQWQNLKIDVQNRDIKTQKLSIFFRTSNTAIFGIQGIVMLYIAAQLVISNEFTIGMLMAFTSYSVTFTGRISKLIDTFVSYRMLDLHTERLADVVLEDAEPFDKVETDLSHLEANVSVRNVKFRYGEGEAWVLDGISLEVKAGENVVLVGPSGCGKTTLCKIILGLLHPTEGEVLINGQSIQQIGLGNFRRIVGTVMQDDMLLAGSIAENISFSDDQPDMSWVVECARMSSIHEEITAMPMGYQTLVGDMGSSLSGGQKQRILLSRALYKKPRVLALDEATSHLDVENEAKVNKALSLQKVTRIMVAHRPETIKSADRVIHLLNGRVIDQVSEKSPEKNLSGAIVL